MFEEEFAARLTELRGVKGVSARDMSLSIGQNPGYIRDIEAGKVMPSMSGFLFICEYLGITPRDFFDTDSHDPSLIVTLTEKLKQLSSEELTHLNAIVDSMISK